MSVRRRKWTDPSTGQAREVWMIDIDFEHADGSRSRVRKKASKQTRRDAEEQERQIRAALLAGTYGKKKEVKQEPPAFGAFADEFLRVYAKNHNKPSTIEGKRIIIEKKLKPAFGGLRLDEIDSRRIEAFVAHHSAAGAKPMTVNNALIVLRRILSLAVEYGLLAKVPTIRKKKVVDLEPDFLTFQEAETLLATPAEEPQWWAMIFLALRTGLRQGELLALKWADVDLEKAVLTVRRSVWEGIETEPKSGKKREVPLSGAVEVLKKHRHQRGPYVFCDPDGKPYNKQQCRRPLKRALKRAGLRNIGWHVLRHTFASHLVMRGAPLPSVQKLLGHSTITMTMRYAHTNKTVERDAVSRLDATKESASDALPVSLPALASSGTMTAQQGKGVLLN
jgi:integrase